MTHKPTDYEDKMLKVQVQQTMDKLLKLKINKIEPYLPKADLTYDEFLCIKNDFNNLHFKQTCKAFYMTFYAHIGLIMLGRLIRKAKLL